LGGRNRKPCIRRRTTRMVPVFRVHVILVCPVHEKGPTRR
jgi:hypothetical protein